MPPKRSTNSILAPARLCKRADLFVAAAALKAAEKAFSQKLQQEGKWIHLWRIAGRYANISIFDVADNDALHTLLSGLPLFPFMQMKVPASAGHPSAIDKTF